MLEDLTTTALHSALDGLSQRQRTTADNISNIETPGFLRVYDADSLPLPTHAEQAAQLDDARLRVAELEARVRELELVAVARAGERHRR